LIDFFIRRPIFASVCSIIITLFGALAIPGLPIAQYPDLAPPQVTVTATYVGASSDVVESAVTVPLEQELNGVEGMLYLSSTSSNDGVSNITVTFDPTRDLEVAAVDVQNRVNLAESRLPTEVIQRGVVVKKASSQLLIAYALYHPEGLYDANVLSNYADVYLKDALKRIKGVGEVRIFGERKFAMRVWLDPTELSRRKLTPQDVVTALREQNILVAAGAVGQAPTNADQPFQLAVRAHGRLVEPSEFEDIVVQRGEGGSAVRLGDVGRAELGAENYGQYLEYSGHEGVGIGIFQLPTANALDVRDAVQAEMERLSADFPPGLVFNTGTDTTLAIRASVNEVLKTLAEAIVLVILVIFLFLHGWRSVVITATTLPVSLIGTFAFVRLMDFSINTLTLFGLTLATGLVVDDAIVVIENIERTMHERGLSARAAASAGMKEVASAVIAISIVLVAVFAPVALFPGTTGVIYRQFALTIAAAMAISAFCALTLTPALSALLLKENHGPKWIGFRAIDRILDGFRDVYGRGLQRALRHPVLLTLAFAGCIAGTVLLFRAMPTGFIPAEDQGYIIIGMQGPDLMPIETNRQVMREVAAVVGAQPEVRGMFMVGGFSFAGTGPSLATIFVMLKPWEERTAAESSVAGVVARLRGPLGAIGGARVVPFQPPSIRGVGNVGGFQFVALDTQAGRGLDDLATATRDLVGAANTDPRLRGIYTAFTSDTPILDVEVNRPKAKALGISLDQIFGTLQAFMGSIYVNDFSYADRTYRVLAQADLPFRDSVQDLTAFYVRNDAGDMIPLESVIDVSETTSAQIIRRYNLFRSAEINGEGAPGISSGQALAAMEEVAAKVLPAGMRGEWTGLSLEEKGSSSETLAIFGMALLLVFLVLAAQYESFVLPFVIILAVPLAMVGALGFQALRGQVNDVFCQVGLVMLIGLASKNAILIVEFAEQLRLQGRSLVDAAVEASRVRLRPILMTSIAFLLGVLPLAMATGAGAAARNSLGTAVFGGMLVSTFVNLLFIPGLYVVVSKVTRRDRHAAVDRHLAPTEPPANPGVA
jgi:HAE1 family hydrophobic/amphiphilic exporter-1